MASGKATVKDIAREVGVSPALVSFVMHNASAGKRVYRVNKDTEKKVLEAAGRLNYVPNPSAQALRNGEVRLLGVIVSDIANKFYAEIARNISDWCAKNNYMVIFGSTDEDSEKLSTMISLFRGKDVAGLVIVPCEGSKNDILKLKESNFPFVLIDRYVPGIKSNTVVLENTGSAQTMTEMLLQKGCRKVEMVSYKTTLPNIKDREKGYITAMRNAGLEYKVYNPDYGNYEQIGSIVKNAAKDGVDGILFATYRLALLGRKAMIKENVPFPSACRVACFNNSEEFETYEKEIIFVEQPVEQFAVRAMELLVSNISDRTSSETNIVLEAKISQF